MTGESEDVTDSRITDLRARLSEELKNSLKVRISSISSRKKFSKGGSTVNARLGTLLPPIQSVCVYVG